MEKIKLVIWDLYNTFWNGTLSEEGIEMVENNVKLVKDLTNRGIINSIASKNDFQKAKEKLTEHGIWEYFVFPAIEWIPKGVAIKNIIEQCQLRNVNVLFLDDNHLNLEEARYYNPNLNFEFPDFIERIPEHQAFKGKDDPENSRLKQYKILEKKAIAKNEFNSDIEFLESSNIQVEFLKGDLCKSNIERIVELLERTNQLNYTKIRSKREEIEHILDDLAYESSLLRVKDNFGDYGLVGFYSLHKKNRHLEHFVFSCSILNLGVAQYTYSLLEFPSLKVIPEVAEELDESTPQWIKIIEREDSGDRKKIFFKVGCDLGQMLFYLKNHNIDIYEETYYVSKNNFPIHQEHSNIILDSRSLSREDKDYIQKSDFILFTDENFYHSKIINADYDCLIFSVLMDYSNELYKHKSRDILLPFGGYHNFWTDLPNHDNLFKTYRKRSLSVSKEILQDFAREFDHVGQILPEDFIENLRKIRNLIPSHIPIIFINGAELESPYSPEKAALRRHQIMNKALEEFIHGSLNTHLLDVRKTVRQQGHLLNNIRHI